jgi:hypothetical protein
MKNDNHIRLLFQERKATKFFIENSFPFAMIQRGVNC